MKGLGAIHVMLMLEGMAQMKLFVNLVENRSNDFRKTYLRA